MNVENIYIPYAIPTIFETSDGKYAIAMEAENHDLFTYFAESDTQKDVLEKLTNKKSKTIFKQVLLHRVKHKDNFLITSCKI